MMSSPDKIQTLGSEAKISRLIEVGIALSAETDLNILLEKIVSYARELTGADAGTLYTVSGEFLNFTIIQNDTLGIRLGGSTGAPISLDPVPINESSVSGFVASKGLAVNIADVYQSDMFDFTGPKRYDKKTGYRSRSMLVVPMRDHDHTVIGVLQLLNALDPVTGEVGEFEPELGELAGAFASQAAVALTNARLINEVRELFDSLIRVLAVAVDAKSPYTGNHVQRVAILNYMIAKAISDSNRGTFAKVKFTDKELDEVRVAGWLHDVGKVTTPVWVMDKATKLATLLDRIELIRVRFELIKTLMENRALKARLGQLGEDEAQLSRTDLMQQAKKDIERLAEDFSFIERVNTPREFMNDQMLNRLNSIATGTFELDGEERRYLTENEQLNLSIRKGSLNEEEINLMRDHVRATADILKEIPFESTRNMKNVAVYAREHHEKLNGKGYPRGLNAANLSIQSRILAIADFYEALSAKDRPYKKPMPPEVVLRILQSAAEDGEIDTEVLAFILENGIHEKFEQEYEARKSERESRQE